LPNSPQPDPESRIDRFVRGELTAAEARELAQESLDHPDLFEDLTASALVNVAAASEPVKQELERSGIDETLRRYVISPPSPVEERAMASSALDHQELFDALAVQGAVERGLANPSFRAAVSRGKRTGLIVAASAAAAAAVLIATYFVYSPPKPQQQAARPMPAGQPIFLASDLLFRLPGGGAPAFRGVAPESRGPRPQGAILSIDEGTATVNLGSLDGVTKGSELPVFRSDRAKPIGLLMVTTVFRDRARCRVEAGPVQVRDQVHPPSASYLTAVLERAEGLAAAGDRKTAVGVARSALQWADTAAVPPGQKRLLLERLADLEYQNGAAGVARQYYDAAAQSLDSAPPASPLERAFALNNLGALQEAAGELPKAEASYAGALQAINAAADASSRDRDSVSANLARVRAAGNAKR
jgi:hypothetical protein